MKKGFTIFASLVLSFGLSGCKERDEYHKVYDIENTDIITAFENDSTLTSVMIQYISYDDDGNITNELEYHFSGDVGYNVQYDVYYQTLPQSSFCTLQYDQELGEGYTRHAVLSPIYQFITDSVDIIYNQISFSTFDITDYEIVDQFYKYEISLVDGMFAYIRVNSQNYIDYFKVTKVIDDQEIVRVEMTLSSHNNTIFNVPESIYMTPFDYAEQQLLNAGYTKSETSSTIITYDNGTFSSLIDFEADTILFTKGDTEVLYDGPEDSASVLLLLGDEDTTRIFDLRYVYSRMEAGSYNYCLE